MPDCWQIHGLSVAFCVYHEGVFHGWVDVIGDFVSCFGF